MEQIKQYGEISQLKKLIKAFSFGKRKGFIPVGFGATKEWKKQNKHLFN